MTQSIDQLALDFGKLRSVVEHFADPANWDGRRYDGKIIHDEHEDGGGLARQVLKIVAANIDVTPMSAHDEFSGNAEAPND